MVSVLVLNSRHGGLFHNKSIPPASPVWFLHFNKSQPQIQTLSRARTYIIVLKQTFRFYFSVCA